MNYKEKQTRERQEINVKNEVILENCVESSLFIFDFKINNVLHKHNSDMQTGAWMC